MIKKKFSGFRVKKRIILLSSIICLFFLIQNCGSDIETAEEYDVAANIQSFADHMVYTNKKLDFSLILPENSTIMQTKEMKTFARRNEIDVMLLYGTPTGYNDSSFMITVLPISEEEFAKYTWDRYCQDVIKRNGLEDANDGIEEIGDFKVCWLNGVFNDVFYEKFYFISKGKIIEIGYRVRKDAEKLTFRSMERMIDSLRYAEGAGRLADVLQDEQKPVEDEYADDSYGEFAVKVKKTPYSTYYEIPLGTSTILNFTRTVPYRDNFICEFSGYTITLNEWEEYNMTAEMDRADSEMVIEGGTNKWKIEYDVRVDVPESFKRGFRKRIRFSGRCGMVLMTAKYSQGRSTITINGPN